MALVIASFDTACTGDDPIPFVEPSDAGSDAVSMPNDDAAPRALCPLGCLPPAPQGWIGPSAVYDGDEAAKPATCPKAYTQTEISAHDVLLNVPDAICKCGPVTYTNDFCAIKVYEYTSSSCGGALPAPSSYSTNTNHCAALFGGTTSLKVTASPAAGGACAFAAGSTELPPPTFGRATVSCGLPQVAACADRSDCVATPLPDQPFSRLCIHATGDLSCPNQDYAAKILSYASTKEQRSCADCSSTGVITVTCGTTFTAASSCPNDMPVSTGAPLPASISSCLTAPASPVLDLVGLAPTRSCAPKTPAKPLGTMTLDQPVTFCCNR